MAEWLVPKITTGKEVEGDQSLGKGASLDLLHPNTVEAKERSVGLPSAPSV